MRGGRGRETAASNRFLVATTVFSEHVGGLALQGRGDVVDDVDASRPTSPPPRADVERAGARPRRSRRAGEDLVDPGAALPGADQAAHVGFTAAGEQVVEHVRPEKPGPAG